MTMTGILLGAFLWRGAVRGAGAENASTARDDFGRGGVATCAAGVAARMDVIEGIAGGVAMYDDHGSSVVIGTRTTG